MRVFHRAFSFLPVALVVAALVAACNSGDKPLEAVDPDAVPRDPDYQLIFNVIQNECTPCHDTGEDEDEDERVGVARAGGGVEPPLVTCDDIYEYRFDIWEEVTKNTMPPGAWPRLSAQEKLAIERWLDNGASVPCR